MPEALARRAALASAALALLVGGATAGAAPESNPRALTLQAVAYEHGEGVPKDPLKAASLYCEAARLGDPEAQYGLAWMFANGRGVSRDDDLAAGLFRLAAEQDYEPAARALAFFGSAEPRLPTCLRISVQLEEGDYAPAYAFFDGTPEPDEIALDAIPREKRKVAELINRFARQYSISPRLVLAVATAESNLEPNARSPKNAMGVMQLIPETAQRFNVRNAYDPSDNVRGGVSYLRWLLAYYRGHVTLAVAAYNAGERAVDRYRGVPPYLETRDYVRRVLGVYKREQHPYDARVADPSPVVEFLQNPAR